MKDLFLIYVNYIGVDHKKNYLYEFIFSDTTKEIDGNEWDQYPASSAHPEPPNERFIKEVGLLTTSDFKFEVIQESSLFAVFDGLDGVVAMAWEDVNDYEQYPTKRLAFHFGETFEMVKNKLYEKDLILELKYEKQKNIK